MLNGKKPKTYLFITLVILGVYTPCFSQDEWVVSDEDKKVLATFVFDSATVRKGKDLFEKNCRSCHGDPGKGNNQPMQPPALDPASEEYQKNTDGEMFFKITNGRGAMPSFKNAFEANQRWELIAYIRSFNKDYKQELPEESTVSEVKSDLNTEWSIDTKSKNITVKLSQTTDNKKVPVKGFEVSVSAKRYFGNLKIDNTKLTDSEGLAKFVFPDDLPGDTAGNIALVLKIEDNKSGISISRDTVCKIGTLSPHVNILEKRAWWNVNSKAPVWLILTYTLAVMAVAGCIFYIISLIYKIWLSGKKQNEVDRT